MPHLACEMSATWRRRGATAEAEHLRATKGAHSSLLMAQPSSPLARDGAADTGQPPTRPIDTGQRLRILDHQVHRVDGGADGGAPEIVASTLKFFSLKVGLVDAGGEAPAYTLRAALVYEHGGAVEELSTTLEPALLGGEAVLKDGVASFKLRISVLSSLCQMKRFRVQVTCVERPELAPVATAPVRTITKLRRGPREPVAGREAEAEAGAGLLGAGAGGLGGRADEGGKRSLESLWDEVSTNGQVRHPH